MFFPFFGEEVELILGLYDSLCSISLRDKSRDNKNRIDDNLFIKYYDSALAFEQRSYSGERLAELNAALQSLFVYCNIVDHSLVGDANAQLLRTVEVPSNTLYADNITLIYDKPHFIPMQTNSYDTINLDIKDDTLEKIPFNFGKVIIKLIFKKYKEKND